MVILFGHLFSKFRHKVTTTKGYFLKKNKKKTKKILKNYFKPEVHWQDIRSQAERQSVSTFFYNFAQKYAPPQYPDCFEVLLNHIEKKTMPEFNFINRLKNKLKTPLPGVEFQYKMANATRQNFKILPAPDHARKACVMPLLVPDGADWKLVLTQRTHIEGDRHSGQISFAGGQLDPTDASLEACALREVWEEIGVPNADIQILGQLTELYIPVSNFQVFPFLGVCQKMPTFTPQPAEVQSILLPNLTHFVGETHKKTKNIRISETVVFEEVPYFDVEGHVVWGATAMILSEIGEIINTI